MGIPAGPHGIGENHAVDPGVDDAVPGLQGDAATHHKKVRQIPVHGPVLFRGIGGRVAEGLHHQIGAERQTGQFF